MEQIVLANEEDTGELLVVVGHHDILRRALAEVEESMDILDAAECLLPQLELDSNVELLETSLEVALQSIGLAQIDGMHLRRVLGSSLDMVAEKLAESSELGLASVLQAKVKGLGSSALVKDLEASIVAKNIEDGSVGLPEELEPRGNDRAVGTVARLLARDGGQENGLGGFACFQIFNVGWAGGSLKAGLDLIGFSLGNSDFFDGKFDEFLQDQLRKKISI